MHYHCEVIFPPDADIEQSVEQVLQRFQEGRPEGEDDGGYSRYAFFDWYTLGGRFAGEKMRQSYDRDKLREFHEWLTQEQITVSGLHCGKPELSPASQQAKVDAKWNEMFPKQGGALVACPLFQHSNNQYSRNTMDLLEGDVMSLNECLHVKCFRVVFAAPSLVGDQDAYCGPLEAYYMVARGEWNGCNFLQAKWDGSIGDAVRMCREHLECRQDRYVTVHDPRDDWQVVTVDYHD